MDNTTVLTAEQAAENFKRTDPTFENRMGELHEWEEIKYCFKAGYKFKEQQQEEERDQAHELFDLCIFMLNGIDKDTHLGQKQVENLKQQIRVYLTKYPLP